MNVESIKTAIAAGRLALKAHAPTIMVVSGVVSMGASVVTASKQTLKVEEVLAKHTPDLEKIEKGESLQLSSYGEQDARNDRVKVYTKTAFDLGKLYAVPGVLFVGGACLIFGGHRLMLQRNATLAIAFTTLQKAFEKYRANATEQMGPDFDRAMLNGHVYKEVIDPETNEVKTVATMDWDDTGAHPYSRVFEQGESSEWQPDLGLNKFFIDQQRKFAQEKLNRSKILYLSDVLTALGFEETPESRVVGWRVRKLPDGTNDIPVVSFGLDNPLPDDWKYGLDHAIYLEFNCQGLIVGGKLQKALEQLGSTT